MNKLVIFLAIIAGLCYLVFFKAPSGQWSGCCYSDYHTKSCSMDVAFISDGDTISGHVTLKRLNWVQSFNITGTMTGSTVIFETNDDRYPDVKIHWEGKVKAMKIEGTYVISSVQLAAQGWCSEQQGRFSLMKETPW